MKKVFYLLLIFCLPLCFTGCSHYISADVEAPNSGLYYGAYRLSDLIHADVQLFKKDSDEVCGGVMYLFAPNKTSTFALKNIRSKAKMKLACSDGKLFDIDWELRRITYNNGFGEGIDQFNNKYNFRTISKEEFKQISDNHKINNEAYLQKSNMLKY